MLPGARHFFKREIISPYHGSATIDNPPPKSKPYLDQESDARNVMRRVQEKKEAGRQLSVRPLSVSDARTVIRMSQEFEQQASGTVRPFKSVIRPASRTIFFLTSKMLFDVK